MTAEPAIFRSRVLLSADQCQESADFAADHYGPGWMDDPATKRIVEALVDAEAALRVYEEAALLFAATKRRNAMTLRTGSVGAGVHPDPSEFARKLCGIPADDEPALLRSKGAI